MTRTILALVVASCAVAATLLVLLGASSGGGGILAWANEANDRRAAEEDLRWRTYAGDLSSASGVTVEYLPPRRRREGLSATLDYGGIGFLAIGERGAPKVAALPIGMLWSKTLSAAFEEADLPEPGRLAQELVSKVALDREDPLAKALERTRLVIPVTIAEPRGTQARTKWTAARLPRNFPARWEEAAQLDAHSAGPYPASHPRVRALIAWILEDDSCLGAAVFGDPCIGAEGVVRAPAGTFAAFCMEEAHLPVVGGKGGAAANDLLLSALNSGVEVTLREPVWRRLGPSNWSLDAVLESTVGRRALQGPVALDVSSLQKDLVLSAVAASEGASDTLELLPLRKGGVLLKAGSQGPTRLRLFFSLLPDRAESQIERARSGRRGRGSARERAGAPTSRGIVVENAEKRPDVELRASSSRARAALLRTKSPV